MSKCLLPVALSGLMLSACVENTTTTSTAASCREGEQTLTTSDARTLCVGLATEAQAPFSEGFYTARVEHVITVKDSDGKPIDITIDPVITDVSQHPMMTMEDGNEHTTPHIHEPDISRAAQGIYTLPAYYIMPSMMGTWDYKVQLEDAGAGETLEAHFTPSVLSVPGTDILVTGGANDADHWTNMMGNVTNRPYKIWLDGVTAVDGGYTLALFVTSQDMTMAMTSDMDHHGMTFPGIYATATLHDADGNEWTIDTVTVRVSTDNGATWTTLDAGDEGYYAGTVTGLQSGQPASVQVELTVNGLTISASGTNPELAFTAP